MEYKCPARESSKYLCDRVAEYQIDGTVWCEIHAKRIIDSKLMDIVIEQHIMRKEVAA